MIIIIGTGKYGISIKNEYYSNNSEIVFYDNDRRKWGKQVDNVRVITLDELINYAKDEKTTLVVGGQSKSILPFIKDIKPLCHIKKLEEKGLVELDISSIADFEYDNSISVGQHDLEQHELRLKSIEKEDRAYQHAKQYIDFKKNHLCQPEIISIEFTNHCNLKCPNCPNAVLTTQKGFMSDEIFEEALKYLPPYANETVSVHSMGEPLLHPKLLTYLSRMAEIGINICISTNGLLLNKELSRKILNILSKVDKSILYISFHTRQSVENWYNFIELYENTPGHEKISFYGQILEHNADDVYKWLNEVGVEDISKNPYIRSITSHSWGGNVEGRRTEYDEIEVKNRIRNCYYLRSRKVSVTWDGQIKCCCYDSNVTQKCGNIFDYANANINPKGYELCKCCDPDWTTGYQ